MKKNNIIILSLLIFLTLGIVLFNYANQLTSLIAEAVAPNPGHSWSELECTTDLCVTATGVGIGTASPEYNLDILGDARVTGNIIASNPTAENHVATKDYVDNLPGLTWPDGGQPGDTLIMGVTGPFWDTSLTWPGSTKSAYDCDQIGGTVYDTGATGTICKYRGDAAPNGWFQAANWQRYSGEASWGGDDCGLNKNSAPTSFANKNRVLYGTNSYDNYSTGFKCSVGTWNVKINPGYFRYHRLTTTVSNIATGRVEIGIY